jgi:hypothetical protein
LTLFVLGGLVASASAASARTELPVFGDIVVFSDGFDSGGWHVDSVGPGYGCPDCGGGRSGDPDASLGVGPTGWTAVRRTITVPSTTSFGAPYENCTVAVRVKRDWSRPTSQPALVNLEAIAPSTWTYMSYSRHVLRNNNEVTISGSPFTPSPHQFVVGVAIVADPNSVDVGSLNARIAADDFTVTCHYFYYP